MTDGQLVECFISRRDEAAFGELVRRHGPMVLGVCRRALPNQQDAEDAFQATFLVLARKAASILPRELVGNWLFGVACRTARKVKATAARHRAREKQVEALPETPVEGEDVDELAGVLDQELERLPEKYRVPVLLCELAGKSRKEVARQLGLPEGTVSSRLATARRMLATRLARRGLGVTSGTIALVLAHNAAAGGLPLELATSTVKVATSTIVGGPLAGAVSTQAAAVAQAVVKAMFVTKLRGMAAGLVVLGMLGVITVAWRGQTPVQDARILFTGHPEVQGCADPPERGEPSRALVVNVRDSAGDLGKALLLPQPSGAQALVLDVIPATHQEPAAGELVVSRPSAGGD